MKIVKINDKISYIPSSLEPLSADIGIIKDNDLWLYDVGCGLDKIEELKGKYNVVISHFHNDHLDNINNIDINNLYVSKETYKHLKPEVINKTNVIIVSNLISIGSIKIFPLPSSHSKGSLALEVDNEYTFIGDSAYGNYKNNRCIYNIQNLKEEIDLLKSLNSKYLLTSHFDGFIRNKNDVILELLKLYDKKSKNSSYIIADI